MKLGQRAIILGVGIWTALLATHGTDPTFPVRVASLGAIAAFLIAMSLA